MYILVLGYQMQSFRLCYSMCTLLCNTALALRPPPTNQLYFQKIFVTVRNAVDRVSVVCCAVFKYFYEQNGSC